MVSRKTVSEGITRTTYQLDFKEHGEHHGDHHGDHHGEHHAKHHGEHHGDDDDEHHEEHQEEGVQYGNEKKPLRDPLSTRGPGSQFPFVLQTKNRGEESDATSINTIVSSGSPDSQGKKCIDKVRISLSLSLSSSLLVLPHHLVCRS